MEINLLRSVKLRLMDELRYVVEKNEVYRDKCLIYHKFPYRERLQMGIVLRNASGQRQRLSADDHAGTHKSHLALARAENNEGRFLQWVWEDLNNLTSYQRNEDVSSQTRGTPTFGENRVFQVAKPMLAGPDNTAIADNFRQIEVTVNGVRVFSEFVDGAKKVFVLPQAPVLGATVLVSYYYSNLTPPGRYYITMATTDQFIIDPLYDVKRELVIEYTTGTELTATLAHGDLYVNFDKLYTVKMQHSEKLSLVRDIDYSIDLTTGVITFLQPLPVGTTLYANYRWVGSRLGPFTVPKEYHYDDTALPGVILAFGNELNAGQKMVLIVYPKRVPCAQLFSGHYNMSFDVDVVCRDPIQLPELTDHIVNVLWSDRRLQLISEGLTLTAVEPGGESEDVYDSNTGDLYYKNSVSIQMMTEYKKFVPFLWDLEEYNMDINAAFKEQQYIVTNQGQMLDLKLVPNTVPFEVKYPVPGGPRYF